jgi:ribosomal protein S18 acetylase RimI-like enzyme
VWEHNQKAIQFYRKWGFEKFGEHFFMVGNDKQNDWLMKKELQ